MSSCRPKFHVGSHVMGLSDEALVQNQVGLSSWVGNNLYFICKSPLELQCTMVSCLSLNSVFVSGIQRIKIPYPSLTMRLRTMQSKSRLTLQETLRRNLLMQRNHVSRMIVQVDKNQAEIMSPQGGINAPQKFQRLIKFHKCEDTAHYHVHEIKDLRPILCNR